MVDTKALEDNIVLLLPKMIGSPLIRQLMKSRASSSLLDGCQMHAAEIPILCKRNTAIIALERVFMQVMSATGSE